MAGNQICRQVPWRDPATEALAKEHLAAWKEGRTGYPWIDACMRQLAQEGWIHHLARHAVACFLTRGDLWVSWEEGAAVFDEKLIDADWAVNNGNWMWLSCSCFFYQYAPPPPPPRVVGTRVLTRTAPRRTASVSLTPAPTLPFSRPP